MELRNKRQTDRGVLGRIAFAAQEFWNFIDRRQIDAQLVSIAILCGSFKILFWSFDYATYGDRPGGEVAAIIAAVGGPWAILQAAAIAFIFQARTRSFEAKTQDLGAAATTTTTTTLQAQGAEVAKP